MNKKSRNIIVILGVVALMLITATVYQYVRATNYKIQIANSYQRTFTELVDYVDSVDNTLTKALLVKTPGELATVSSELWRKSAFAQACIGQLPTSTMNLEATNKFLSQVGDYAYVMSKKVMDGGTMSDEEYKTMKTLAGYAVKLNSNLQDMESKLYAGEIKFNTASQESKDFYGTKETAVSDGLTATEEEFADYPSLIYDGPFSDHLENPEVRMLKGKDEISNRKQSK